LVDPDGVDRLRLQMRGATAMKDAFLDFLQYVTILELFVIAFEAGCIVWLVRKIKQ
jgi:hypothetical protein